MAGGQGFTQDFTKLANGLCSLKSFLEKTKEKNKPAIVPTEVTLSIKKFKNNQKQQKIV